MPRRRDLREAHVEGRPFDDGEIHLPSQSNRAPKKARRTQRGDDEDGNEATASLGAAKKEANVNASDSANGNEASSSGGGSESGEEAGDERTSNSEDGISRASALSTKYTESRANNEMDNGRSDGEGDENALDNEEIQQGVIPRRRGMAKEDANSDSSQSRSSSSDGESGEEEEEPDDEEKKPDESTAFGRAFQKIMKKKLPSTALTEAMGPMLSAHKQLVTKKLEEAAEGQKAKRESKKVKQALREKGHTVPALFPAAKDKELLKLATRGVVKLFNAVSKAQSVQGAVVSKDSEAKEVAKRSKSTFLATLQGGNGAVSQSLNTQRQPSDSKKEGVADGQPGWSALQETFMLGKSRLKDWDKKEGDAADLKGAESSGDDSDSSE